MTQGEKYNASQVDERHRDHALFIAYAPADDPKIAIAMIVENAGFGAQTPRRSRAAPSTTGYGPVPERGRPGRRAQGPGRDADRQAAQRGRRSVANRWRHCCGARFRRFGDGAGTGRKRGCGTHTLVAALDAGRLQQPPSHLIGHGSYMARHPSIGKAHMPVRVAAIASLAAPLGLEALEGSVSPGPIEAFQA